MKKWTSVTRAADVFATALERHGVGVERGRYGATWTSDPARRAADLKLVRGWLDEERPPAMLHRPAPWGPVPISGMPVALTPAERTAYDAEWGEFCREMDIARRGRSVAKGRAALLRFRQKAGLVRVDSTVAWIAQQVEAERQVACSVEFVATAADPIADRLRDAGIEVASIYGRGRFDAEAERLRFQTGDAQGLCLHHCRLDQPARRRDPRRREAGQYGATGRRLPPRAFRGSPGRQVTGRTHRDHQVSPWHIAWAEGTVEEQVGRVMVERIAAASDTVGGDTGGLADDRATPRRWLAPGTALRHDRGRHVLVDESQAASSSSRHLPSRGDAHRGPTPLPRRRPSATRRVPDPP